MQATAIPGTAIDADRIPGSVQTLRASDLSHDGSSSLTGTLAARFGSISIDANFDDPFQPDVLYRGFEASPVLGTPEGLAVYQNGVRINEAFGDTVNWDLLPDIAIDRVDLISSNPVYGLNALGGALSVRMKNGFTYDGIELEPSGGSFGERALALQYGANSGPFGFYLAGKALDESGWRLFSSDSLRQLYSVVSVHGGSGSLDLSYTLADNHLNGQGAAPIQELAISRSLVFTGPQANANRVGFLAANGTLALPDSWSLQGVLYDRQYRQDVVNGNTTNYVSCTDAPGGLCEPDGLTPLNNAAGAVLPDISADGSVPIGETDLESIRAYGRGLALQLSNATPLAAHGNHFTAGATLDVALVHFQSDAEVGVIGPGLEVLPTDLLVDTPEDSAAGAAFGATPVDLKAMSRDYGLYATDTLDVTPRLAMTASGRYNVADIDLRDQRGTDLTGDNRYAHFNPALGATYRVQPALTAYGGVSANTRAPTASEIECSDPLRPCLLPSNLAGDPPTLRQVVSHTSEFGLRGRLTTSRDDGGPGDAGHGSLEWNAGAFRTGLHDDIYGIATSVSRGFFRNIGDTRRQGFEAALHYRADPWSAYLSYSFVEATFESALAVPSPANAFADANGDIQVRPGDRLPGIPHHRLKLGADYRITPAWSVGTTLNLTSSQYYFGDESNQNAPMPGYHVVGLHSSYRLARRIELFASIDNLLDSRYSTYGILGDPTGVGAPGIPASGMVGGPGVDNRFQSPAPPFAIVGGARIRFD